MREELFISNFKRLSNTSAALDDSDDFFGCHEYFFVALEGKGPVFFLADFGLDVASLADQIEFHRRSGGVQVANPGLERLGSQRRTAHVELVRPHVKNLVFRTRVKQVYVSE